jgi:hypothetical protein
MRTIAKHFVEQLNVSGEKKTDWKLLSFW